jgi:FkbM family methyltransferase
MRSAVKRACLSLADHVLARPSMEGFNRRLLVLALRGMGYNHCCEPERTGELRLIQRLARRDFRLCIDVGANVGDYSTAVLEHSSAKVVAFEPLPTAAAVLRRLAARHPQRFEVVETGVGDRVAEMDLRFGDDTSVLASFSPAALEIEYVAASAWRTLRVPVITLDEYFFGAQAASVPPARIDLLKIDVEGFEFEVLTGAARVLRELAPRVVQLEFNRHQLHSGRSLLDLARLLPQHDAWQILPYGSGLRRVDAASPNANIYHYANFAFIHRDESWLTT